jgi:hypothetical protein
VGATTGDCFAVEGWSQALEALTPTGSVLLAAGSNFL